MVPEEISVRLATLADLNYLQQDHFVPGPIVRRKIEWGEFFVAELDGVVVGFLQMEYLWSIVPYMGLIYVEPAYRRRGVGKAMLGHVEAFLLARQQEVLYSSSQADEPEPQAWHRHMGFEECGVIAGINEGGVGEIFFRKRLR